MTMSDFSAYFIAYSFCVYMAIGVCVLTMFSSYFKRLIVGCRQRNMTTFSVSLRVFMFAMMIIYSWPLAYFGEVYKDESEEKSAP